MRIDEVTLVMRIEKTVDTNTESYMMASCDRADPIHIVLYQNDTNI